MPLFGFGNGKKKVREITPVDDRPRAIVFLDIYRRKFWNLLTINVLYAIINIPAIVAAFLLSSMYVVPTVRAEGMTDVDFSLAISGDVTIRFIFILIVTAIPMVCIGPCQAGLTYILRNFAREEHAFLFHDFRKQSTRNIKQTLPLM
ncbi:MAG: hypothetical protein FWE70_02035, partial [Oscillospiraceae bacterium]|nr:hypothetical protein [Oscillospiraceae bacterium]